MEALAKEALEDRAIGGDPVTQIWRAGQGGPTVDDGERLRYLGGGAGQVRARDRIPGSRLEAGDDIAGPGPCGIRPIALRRPEVRPACRRRARAQPGSSRLAGQA